MRDIKKLLKLAKAECKEDVPLTRGEVKEEFEEESKALDKKAQLIVGLNKYNNADELMRDSSLAAAKRMCIEMETGKTSGDRQKASETILNRSLGKPVDRMLSLNMEMSQYSGQELITEIVAILSENTYIFELPEVVGILNSLGYTKEKK